ncbi:MAG: hypothetical protein AAFP19_00370 [Bacteroidota bacterium]
MRCMKKWMLLLLVFTLPYLAQAQRYRTAAGIRVGTEIGLTYQQRLFDKTTLETILESKFKSDELALTFLLERHHKLIGRRLNFYLGAGIRKGWYTGNNPELRYEDPAGIAGIAGVELTIDRLNLSWDWRPVMNVLGGESFFDSQTAISLRYVFIKQKKKKINWKFWERNKKKKKKRRWG